MTGLKASAGLVLIIAFLSACEDFQSETYDISRIDADACTIISDTTFKNIPTKTLQQINNRWTVQQFQDSTVKAITLLQEMNSTVTVWDSCYRLLCDEASDSSYLALATNGQPVIFYLNDYLNIEIVDNDGQQVQITDNTVTAELVGGCIEELNEKFYPLIKTRLEFEMPSGEYLVRVIKIDQTDKTRFKTAILNKQ